MKFFVIALVISALQPFALAAKQLNVVATLPDYGAIAEAVGKDKVKVTTLAKGTEDPHFVDAKPSFIRVINQADVLLEGGVELEVGWLPPLVNSSRNSKILGDAPGHVNLSQGIRLLEVPTTAVDRSMGDIHPFGNPHYNLDPLNGKIMAEHIAHAFAKLDGANAAFYEQNAKDLSAAIDKKMGEWEKLMEPYKGAKILTYHKSFEYLADRFGLNIIGQIEPKPGVEPSPTHISTLIPRAKSEGAKLVVIEPNRPRKTPEYVAQHIEAHLVTIPVLVGGGPGVKTYIDLFDYDLKEIVNSLKQSK